MPGVSTTSLIDRLKAQKCELCGATDNLVMHHVRKLGELKGKENWEKLMIARRRKTMAVAEAVIKRYIMERFRLTILAESRIRWKMYVRFGGEYWETFLEIRQGAGYLAYIIRS